MEWLKPLKSGAGCVSGGCCVQSHHWVSCLQSVAMVCLTVEPAAPDSWQGVRRSSVWLICVALVLVADFGNAL